jgi:hypothetical protein
MKDKPKFLLTVNILAFYLEKAKIWAFYFEKAKILAF